MAVGTSWFSRGRKLQERLANLSLWGGTILFLLAAVAWVFSMKLSMDPYFVMAPWARWRGPLQQGGVEKFYSPPLGGEQGMYDHTIDLETNKSRPGEVNETQAGDGSYDEFFIQQTGIRGKTAVDRFRAHVSCFSESGRWVYNLTPRKLPWMAVKDYRWVYRCDNEHTSKKRGPDRGIMGERADAIALSHGSGGNWSVREELKWEWQTNETGCPFHPIERDDFCRRIGSNRHILVVGDSISHEISVALQNALAMNRTSTITTQKHPSEEMCSDIWGGEGKGFRVHFIRNDYLSPVISLNQVGRSFEYPWMERLDEGDIKILILNRGAHYRDDKSLINGLRTTFSILRERHPDLLIIYRNTPPGHVNCSQFQHPIPQPIKGSPPSFHWEDFDQQNWLTKSIVEEFNYIYVDVARAIGMRPEGHMSSHDCLHYCQPGPLDLAVEMIYNVLFLL